MYSRIINPSNQKSVRVNSVLGKRILRNYINMLVGGSDTDTPVEEDDGDEYGEDGTWRDPLEKDEVAYRSHDWELKKSPETGEPLEWEYIFRPEGVGGKRYTKKEFEDYYGGTDEWDDAPLVKQPVPYGGEWVRRIDGDENILSGEYTHHKKIVLSDADAKHYKISGSDLRFPSL